MIDWRVAVLAAVGAGVSARLVANFAITKAPPSLIRTNISRDEVPAVLGWAVVAGALKGAGLIALWIAFDYRERGCGGTGNLCIDLLIPPPWNLVWIPLVPVIGMFAAGTWDDLRGDERPRGFGGHFAAVRGGALTGGVVKLVIGGVVALVTVAALDGWRPPPLADWLLFAAPIALTANLINLMDRAPGRALKVFLVLALPLFVLIPAWRPLGAGAIGAALALLPLDLRARGMLGDAGANPLGAVLGLGLVVGSATLGRDLALTRVFLVMLVVVLLALNLASEKWSFSKVIDNTPWLARLDHLGRK